MSHTQLKLPGLTAENGLADNGYTIRPLNVHQITELLIDNLFLWLQCSDKAV